MLIEPFGNDQFYNAYLVEKLGVGEVLPPFKMSVDDLVHALSKKLLTPEYRRRTEALSDRLWEEDGLDTACHLIDTYLERVRSGEENRSTQAVPLLYRSHPPDLDRPAVAVQPHQSGEGEASIPRIIHQTWKNAIVPPDLIRYQRTWQTHHSDWTYYLWTDKDNREFLRRHYPWFLSVYDTYAESIMRVDAVRYFILYHYGGVYADLDAECFKSLEPILKDGQIILSLEREVHLKMHQRSGYPLTEIVSNALMASVPGHPFWEHVFKQLVAHHHAAGALDATGPFFLTRAYESYPDKQTIAIEPTELILPVTNEMPWHKMSPELREQISRSAYTAHHWRGTWYREPVALRASEVGVSLLVRGVRLTESHLRLDLAQQLVETRSDRPLVSCLMVTKNRPALAKLAIRCFLHQTYSNKELIIVDDGEDDRLERWIAESGHAQVRYVRLPAEGKTLGALRNIAVNKARGTYVAQWDDDDLSHPQRLQIQLTVIHFLHTDACTLERQVVWWPASRRLAASSRRLWEGSFVCAKAKLPPYPAQAQGEDTPAIQQVVTDGRVALLNVPQLYIYVFHGENTFAAEHWEKHWQAATERYEGDMYDVVLRQMQDELKLDLANWTDIESDRAANLKAGEGAFSVEKPEVATASLQEESVGKKVKALEVVNDAGSIPRVLILTPVKDATRYLPLFWKNLKMLSYPHDRISLAFLESDSTDATSEFIEENLPELLAEFSRVQLFKRDYAYRTQLHRWDQSEQFRRRSIMAKSRNLLLVQALEDEDWVLWIDVDVARWPEDIIEQLLAVQKEIVVPNCLSEGSGETFDHNTFKLKPEAGELDWSPYIIDGILQPPTGIGRYYLSDLRQHDCVEIDAVGGTMLLIRADLHREGLVFPAFSYKHHIETEGLAVMAQDMGYTCWGLPNLDIYHP